METTSILEGIRHMDPVPSMSSKEDIDIIQNLLKHESYLVDTKIKKLYAVIDTIKVFEDNGADNSYRIKLEEILVNELVYLVYINKQLCSLSPKKYKEEL